MMRHREKHGSRSSTLPLGHFLLQGLQGPLHPRLVLLATADAAQGKTVAKKCGACHSFDKDGPNKVGPNLWDIVGAKHAHKADFNYSDAIKGMADKEWTYAELDAFITAPKTYAPGTKMTFPGIKKPEERAALIAYLRSLSDNPKPLP